MVWLLARKVGRTALHADFYLCRRAIPLLPGVQLPITNRQSTRWLAYYQAEDGDYDSGAALALKDAFQVCGRIGSPWWLGVALYQCWRIRVLLDGRGEDQPRLRALWPELKNGKPGVQCWPQAETSPSPQGRTHRRRSRPWRSFPHKNRTMGKCPRRDEESGRPVGRPFFTFGFHDSPGICDTSPPPGGTHPAGRPAAPR